jgi:hypothetical protein
MSGSEPYDDKDLDAAMATMREAVNGLREMQPFVEQIMVADRAGDPQALGTAIVALLPKMYTQHCLIMESVVQTMQYTRTLHDNLVAALDAAHRPAKK